MDMHLNLCESYTCLQQVRLEETVRDSNKHYSLYTIKNDKTVVAVLMDVKLTSHKKFQHALGQVRSQFSSFELPSPFSLAAPWVLREDGENPPLCALLSEKGMQVVCFPYCLETTVQPVPVVDCLVLPELPLFTATCIPTVNQSLLVLILLLTDEDVHFYKNMNLLLLKDATRKSSLETHIQSLNEKMADELCEMKRKREDVERQIEDEKCKREDAERKREDAERQIEDEKRKREDVERQIEYVERKREDEKRKREDVERQIEDAERKREDVERKREDVERQIEDEERKRKRLEERKRK